MNNKTKNVKVISKNTKGGKSKKSKKGSKLDNIFSFIKKHIKLIILFIVLLAVLLGIILGLKNSSDKKIVTIDGIVYTESDFMIYLYSAKYNYFGDRDINQDELDVVYNDEDKMTVREYLKLKAMSDIKTAAAIKSLASDNNILLTEKDYSELETDKEEFISELGGKSKFKKFLKENNTTEESFDKMSETDKLYKKLLNNLYGEGKLKDLTEEEYNDAKNNYKSNYVKINQIILTTVDVNTGKSLSVTTINQKEALARTIVSDAKNGTSFVNLLKKYSEDAIDKEAPYYSYYKKGELLPEIEDEVFLLKVGEISKPIKTKYAYHIIEKLELDDSKLGDYYDDLREEKSIEDIKKYLEDLKIIYHDAYENIKIK